MAKAETELLKEILAELKLIRVAVENKEMDEDDDNDGIDEEPDETDQEDKKNE